MNRVSGHSWTKNCRTLIRLRWATISITVRMSAHPQRLAAVSRLWGDLLALSPNGSRLDSPEFAIADPETSADTRPA